MLKHVASFAFRNSSDVPKWFQQAMASQSQRRRPAQSVKLIVPNTWFLHVFYTSVISVCHSVCHQVRFKRFHLFSFFKTT